MVSTMVVRENASEKYNNIYRLLPFVCVEKNLPTDKTEVVKLDTKWDKYLRQIHVYLR